MRWEGGEQSGNVEDRRSAGGAGGMLGGRGLSMGTLVIAVIAAMIFGVNPLQLLGMLSGGPMQVQQSPQTESASPQSAANDRDLQFTRTVLRDTEMVWDKLFRDAGGNYIQPKLVFSAATRPRPAARANRPWGRFIARWIRRCTWIPSFSTPCALNWAAAATLPKPTWLHTKWGTTYNTKWARSTRSTPCAGASAKPSTTRYKCG